MAQAHREIERKYEAPEDAVLDLTGLTRLHAADVPDEQELDATYFDTADGALARAQMVARRRRGGHDEGWHIKFTLGTDRHEVHFPLLKDRTSMPAAFRSALAAVVLGQPLEPVLHLGTHRTRTLLQDGAGRQVAEVCDDTVVSLDYATGIERRWREWEIELGQLDLGKKEQKKIFAEAEEALRSAGARPSSAVAKSARALGKDPAFDHEHGIEQPKALKKTGKKAKAASELTGGERLVSALLQDQVDALGPWTVAVEAGVEGSEESLREAVRGLRTVLRVLDGALEARGDRDLAFPRILESLDSVEQALSSVVELDVVREVLLAEAAWPTLTQAGRQEILDLLSEDHDAAATSLRGALQGAAWSHAVAAVHALAGAPRLAGWAQGLSGRKAGQKLLKKLHRSAADGTESLVEAGEFDEVAESLAEVQAAARELRHAVESVREAVDLPSDRKKQWKARRKQAKKVQSRLDPLLELNTAREWTARAARVFQRRGLDRFAVGVLSGRLERALEDELSAGLPTLG